MVRSSPSRSKWMEGLPFAFLRGQPCFIVLCTFWTSCTKCTYIWADTSLLHPRIHMPLDRSSLVPDAKLFHDSAWWVMTTHDCLLGGPLSFPLNWRLHWTLAWGLARLLSLEIVFTILDQSENLCRWSNSNLTYFFSGVMSLGLLELKATTCNLSHLDCSTWWLFLPKKVWSCEPVRSYKLLRCETLRHDLLDSLQKPRTSIVQTLCFAWCVPHGLLQPHEIFWLY